MTSDDPLRSDRLQPAWLMFIDCTPAVRVWNGAAVLKLGPSGPDTAGGYYQGLGVSVALPQLKLPINGVFAAHTFSLSGVTEEMMRLVDLDRAVIKGAALSWALLPLDPELMPIGDPVWLWKGFIDTPRLARDGDTSPPTRTISLVVSTGSITRKRRQHAYYTPAQQRAIDANDAACDQVPTYAAGTDTIWPT